MRKWTPEGSKREPKGAKMSEKVTEREPKGAKREPKGAKREPKVSQVATKVHPKIDVRKRSRKGLQKGCPPDVTTVQFGSHFPSEM